MKLGSLSAFLFPAVIVAAGFGAVYGLTGYIEEHRPRLAETYVDNDLEFLGARVRGFAFGAEGLIADWYFVRSLQYIGDKIVASKETDIDLDDLRSLNPRLMYPLLDNATDLDPHFIAAYSYGAVVLPAIDPHNAIALAEKGIVNNPESWRLYQHLGYIHWRLGDHAKAADTYERGSQITGASPFMKLMAAMMRSEGGSRDTARAIFREMLENSDDPNVRITAERRLAELDWFDERDAINPILAEFRERNGRCPANFGEVTRELLGVKLPGGRQFRIDSANRLVDPSDAPYLLDKEKCEVKLDIEATKLPLR
jgi:tetratricopeptide (TPR) repeat protein